MQKRGLSQIVSTVLIILLALAAIAIIWTVVSTMIRNSTTNADNRQLAFTSKGFSLSNIKVDEQNNIQFNVEREGGEGELGFKIVLYDNLGNSFVVSNWENETLMPLENIIVTIYATSADGNPFHNLPGNLTEVEVYSVISTSRGPVVSLDPDDDAGSRTSPGGNNPGTTSGDTTLGSTVECISDSACTAQECKGKCINDKCDYNQQKEIGTVCNSGNGLCLSNGQCAEIISACGTSLQSGKNYTLKQDITSSGTSCLIIPDGTRNVLVDGLNHKITGADSGTGIVSQYSDNLPMSLTFKNLAIDHFRTGISAAMSNSTVSNMNFTNINITGLNLAVGHNNLIEKNYVSSNGQAVQLWSSFDTNNKIINNTLKSNNNDGIYVRTGAVTTNIIAQNKIIGSGGNGVLFEGGPNTVFSDNIICGSGSGIDISCLPTSNPQSTNNIYGTQSGCTIPASSGSCSNFITDTP